MKKIFLPLAISLCMALCFNSLQIHAQDRNSASLPQATPTPPDDDSDPFAAQMVLVQGGAYTMGCTAEQGIDCIADEKPAHSVTVSTFSISKYEVTQAQWQAIMGSNPSYFSGCAQCPVDQVNYEDIQAFLKRLNQRTGKSYRLPTEAEWEYAARGGNKTKGYKYSGSNNIGRVAWYDENSGDKTHVVGGKAPNELGLYDMSGNVWEWCADWYKGYPGSSSVHVQDYTGSLRVLRGGSWNYDAGNCRVAYRSIGTPTDRHISNGFRLAVR